VTGVEGVRGGEAFAERAAAREPFKDREMALIARRATVMEPVEAMELKGRAVWRAIQER
jgi:hypothetical protein